MCVRHGRGALVGVNLAPGADVDTGPLSSVRGQPLDPMLDLPEPTSDHLLRLIHIFSEYPRENQPCHIKAHVTTTIKSLKTFRSCKLQHATSNFLVAAIKPARKWVAPNRPHAPDACRSIGPAVEPSTRVGLSFF